MIWEKLGQVYFSDSKYDWQYNSALTPTPVVFEDKIRIYCGFRDKNGVSRIGFVDLDKNDPTKIIRVSDKPALDIGNDGCFDDNGVILGDVVWHGKELRMYYVGFQLPKKVKFMAFTGLAISYDNGETFIRTQETPILERVENGKFIRAIHTVLFEDDIWKVWFATGNGWEIINGTPYPKYHINYLESNDGVKDFKNETVCIQNINDEYRIGRPRVYKLGESYFCIYTKGTIHGEYSPGLAISKDGINWTRQDSLLNLGPSEIGWDSETLCYPALFTTNSGEYAVYNGNNMGEAGFGLLRFKTQEIKLK